MDAAGQSMLALEKTESDYPKVEVTRKSCQSADQTAESTAPEGNVISKSLGRRAPAPAQLSPEAWVAWLVWLIPMIIIGAMVIHNPWKRTVTHLYHAASANWWEGKDLYQGPAGMNYLPHFAIVFRPFQLLPVPVGDLLWRFSAAALLAFGIWRFVKLVSAGAAPRIFLWVSVVALPLCLAALRNGQSNAMFAGLTVNAVVCLYRKEWWGSVGLIILALAIKPLGLVLLLLAPVVYPPVRWRSAVAVAAFLVFPFLFARTDYVLAQHRSFIANIKSCAVVNQHRFADINGVFRTFGTAIPPTTSKFVRLIAGMLTAGLLWFGSRRVGEPLSALWLYALATAYLMLFNPMNEANSYVIFAPAAGLWFGYWIQQNGARKAGWAAAAMLISMGLLPTAVRPLFGNSFALFWHPVMTGGFVGLVTWYVLTQQKPVQVCLQEQPGIIA